MTDVITEVSNKSQPNLLWRIFKWVLLAVLIIFLLLSLIGFWAFKVQGDYESTAVPYLEAVVPEVTTWDPDVLWAYFDENVKSTIDRDEYVKVIEYFSLLGSLESMGQPEFRQVTSSATLRTGRSTFIVYQIPAEFENGDAIIAVTLTEAEGEFSVAHFHISSMAFAELAIQQQSDPSTVDETEQ